MRACGAATIGGPLERRVAALLDEGPQAGTPAAAAALGMPACRSSVNQLTVSMNPFASLACAAFTCAFVFSTQAVQLLMNVSHAAFPLAGSPSACSCMNAAVAG